MQLVSEQNKNKFRSKTRAASHLPPACFEITTLPSAHRAWFVAHETGCKLLFVRSTRHATRTSTSSATTSTMAGTDAGSQPETHSPQEWTRLIRSGSGCQEEGQFHAVSFNHFCPRQGSRCWYLTEARNSAKTVRQTCNTELDAIVCNIQFARQQRQQQEQQQQHYYYYYYNSGIYRALSEIHGALQLMSGHYHYYYYSSGICRAHTHTHTHTHTLLLGNL